MMSTENNSAGDSLPDNASGQLSENVMESVSVQERGGTLSISVPKAAGKDLGLEKGDSVLVTGREGDRTLNVKPSDAIFADD